MEQLVREIKRIYKFGVVGILNTLIDFGTFTLLNSVFHLNYLLCQVLGYSLGIANSFFMNSKWTFKDRQKHRNTGSEFIQFIAVNLVSLIIGTFSIKYLVGYLMINVYISKILVTLITQLTNFLGYKLWVFGKKSNV